MYLKGDRACSFWALRSGGPGYPRRGREGTGLLSCTFPFPSPARTRPLRREVPKS